jgi:putative phosphoesterase
MNVAIISDSHDNVKRLKQAISVANDEKCEYLIHLGDIVSPYTAGALGDFKGIIKAVFGNCDGDKIGLFHTFESFDGEIKRSPYSFTIMDKRFAIMHEPDFLDELVLSRGFDYILYGHLHKIDIQKKGETRVINPGESAGVANAPTFVIINIRNDKIKKIDLI